MSMLSTARDVALTTAALRYGFNQEGAGTALAIAAVLAVANEIAETVSPTRPRHPALIYVM